MEKIIIEQQVENDYATTEAFRTLKTNLQFSGAGIKSILFTSTIPNEGKSTVTFRLANEFASSGKKVLFIDCDLRKSVLIGRYHAHSENGNEIKGLSHYLTGQEILDNVICQTNVADLDIIFSGPFVPNPTELLEDVLFSDMIKTLRERYDIIILDAPPLANVIDAAIIGKSVDAAVLVIRDSYVSRRVIVKAKRQLESSGVRILGAVLNAVNMKKNSYYGKYYGKYYGQDK